jgi:hypothetical protein
LFLHSADCFLCYVEAFKFDAISFFYFAFIVTILESYPIKKSPFFFFKVILKIKEIAKKCGNIGVLSFLCDLMGKRPSVCSEMCNNQRPHE